MTQIVNDLTIITVALENDENFQKTINLLKKFKDINKKLITKILVVTPDQSVSLINGVQVLLQDPRGIYPAMNAGITASTTEWIWFINSGDEPLLNDTVQQIIMNNQDWDALCSPVKTVSAQGEFLYSGGLSSPHQGIIYKKKIFQMLGLYDEQYKLISERLFFDKMKRLNARIFMSSVPIARFFENGASFTNKGRRLAKFEYLKWLSHNPLDWRVHLRLWKL